MKKAITNFKFLKDSYAGIHDFQYAEKTSCFIKLINWAIKSIIVFQNKQKCGLTVANHSPTNKQNKSFDNTNLILRIILPKKFAVDIDLDEIPSNLSPKFSKMIFSETWRGTERCHQLFKFL